MNKVKSAFCLIQLFSSSKQIKTEHASSPVIDGINNFAPLSDPVGIILSFVNLIDLNEKILESLTFCNGFISSIQDG